MKSTIWRALAADVSTVVKTPWGVRDQVTRQWIFETPGFDRPSVGADFADDGFLVCFGSGATIVDPDGPDEADVVLASADLLQVLVCDELGRGWPEYAVAGQFSGLLVPGRHVDGIGWAMTGGPVFPLGSLPVL